MCILKNYSVAKWVLTRKSGSRNHPTGVLTTTADFSASSSRNSSRKGISFLKDKIDTIPHENKTLRGKGKEPKCLDNPLTSTRFRHYNPRAKCHPPSSFLNVLLAMPIYFHIKYNFFHTTMVELNSCHRVSTAPQNLKYLLPSFLQTNFVNSCPDNNRIYHSSNTLYNFVLFFFVHCSFHMKCSFLLPSPTKFNLSCKVDFI